MINWKEFGGKGSWTNQGTILGCWGWERPDKTCQRANDL